MSDFTGLYYSENLVFKETSALDFSLFSKGTALYEVLRINEGTALFLEDHLQRLQESIRLSGCTYYISIPSFHYLLGNLIKKNNTSHGNVKIMVHFTGESQPTIYTFFIPHAWPGSVMYSEGVDAGLFRAMRVNPNIKKMHPEMIRQLSEFIRTEKIYDALLIDEQDVITEGSKTNVFFVAQDCLFTAPADNVLRGITREKIIKLCIQLKLNIIESTIATTQLSEFDAAFFTGTSPKVLPIRRIGNIQYNVKEPLMHLLMHAYDNLIAEYLNQW
jgi:branched-chain amino acid aminotransferase